MSNFNEVSDFAAFYRMYKQWESENQRLEGLQPQQSAGPQHPASQAQCPPLHRISPARHRSQPYRQTPPPRNASEFSTFSRNLDEIKKRLNDIYATVAVLDNLQNSLEQIKVIVEENMARMNGNMERFEVIGRNFLKQALQPSNSQPPNSSSSQPQTTSNTPPFSQHASQQQNPYGQGPQATQPSASFVPSSNPSQPLFAPPPSQAPESYSDPNYIDYIDSTTFDFLGNNTS